MRKSFRNLGIGIGLRPYHVSEIMAVPPAIDWFELISEHFLNNGPKCRPVLEWLLEHYPLTLHGVSMCIGSSDPLDFEYLKKLKALGRKTKTPWISDHLSWGAYAGTHFHELLPLPFTSKVANFVSERARIVQDFLEIPFVLENVASTSTFSNDEMPEWEFVTHVAEKADIGLLLDLNNLMSSSQKKGFDPSEYVRHIDLNRVTQVHLNGNTQFMNNVPGSEEARAAAKVWELYQLIHDQHKEISTLVEWEEKIPFEEAKRNALQIKDHQIKDHQKK